MLEKKQNRFEKSIQTLQDKSEPVAENINSKEKSENGVNVLDNILSAINKEPQGKNYAFHLSYKVGEAVTKIAEQKGISKSKLVDNILKQVLLNENL